jgi:hypothetical protein
VSVGPIVFFAMIIFVVGALIPLASWWLASTFPRAGFAVHVAALAWIATSELASTSVGHYVIVVGVMGLARSLWCDAVRSRDRAFAIPTLPEARIARDRVT